jgi:hypothetical protein
MASLRHAFDRLRYLNWYFNNPAEIPLSSDLAASLPLPDLAGVSIRWPERYAWGSGRWYLDMVKEALARFVPVELLPVAARDRSWHDRGGFPVPAGKSSGLGGPRQPKDAYDLRGEVFEVRRGGAAVRCAYDYSDYPILSEAVLDGVDLYFKCVAPPGALPEKAAAAGYFRSRPRLLGKARSYVLKEAGNRDIDVYARFGTWTDSQGFREVLVKNVRRSSLRFQGGFGTLPFPAYLKELMRAKISLDAPGQAPITCRLPESMALGAVVVSARPACVFPEPLVEGEHYAATRDDSADVVEVCRDLLRNEEKRRRISVNAAAYFDRNFSPQSIARRILRRAVASLSAGGRNSGPSA